MATYPTPAEIDAAVPVDGTPSRALTNAALKAVSEPPTWAQVTGKPTSFPPATHTHTAAQISDATATGRSVLTATDAAAARTAIGAGTSSLEIGTTSTTAKAGNYQPTWGQVSGKPGLLTEATAAPATPESTGTKGQYAIAGDVLYICTDTDTWRSVALTEWTP